MIFCHENIPKKNCLVFNHAGRFAASVVGERSHNTSIANLSPFEINSDKLIPKLQLIEDDAGLGRGKNNGADGRALPM